MSLKCFAYFGARLRLRLRLGLITGPFDSVSDLNAMLVSDGVTYRYGLMLAPTDSELGQRRG